MNQLTMKSLYLWNDNKNLYSRKICLCLLSTLEKLMRRPNIWRMDSRYFGWNPVYIIVSEEKIPQTRWLYTCWRQKTFIHRLKNYEHLFYNERILHVYVFLAFVCKYYIRPFEYYPFLSFRRWVSKNKRFFSLARKNSCLPSSWSTICIFISASYDDNTDRIFRFYVHDIFQIVRQCGQQSSSRLRSKVRGMISVINVRESKSPSFTRDSLKIIINNRRKNYLWSMVGG